ncbi:hypothetical protein ACIHCM_35045 [Streptomyces sp. NPDC052023]|uniref:hypothetical protein n=1 Tax=Streptomyces sp. NPDC052023 TaxID=3365681 RepID=UPI0037CF738B
MKHSIVHRAATAVLCAAATVATSGCSSEDRAEDGAKKTASATGRSTPSTP